MDCAFQENFRKISSRRCAMRIQETCKSFVLPRAENVAGRPPADVECGVQARGSYDLHEKKRKNDSNKNDAAPKVFVANRQPCKALRGNHKGRIFELPRVKAIRLRKSENEQVRPRQTPRTSPNPISYSRSSNSPWRPCSVHRLSAGSPTCPSARRGQAPSP